MFLKEGISVIICCYNSAKRLPVTLEHLAKQIVSPAILWEVIVVDNASTDDTVTVADTAKELFTKQNIDYRVVLQPIAGLSHAREKGIEAAHYEYLLFCDDDNWLSAHYVEGIYHTFKSDRRIGVVGGFASFEPELPCSELIRALGGYYCNGPQEEKAKNLFWVYGAGSAYRKSILLDILATGWQQIATGRTGNKLISGDDIELCHIMHLFGYKVVGNDTLTFKHFVPHQRQHTQYLYPLFFWIAYSGFLLKGYDILINNDQRPLGQIIWSVFKDETAKLIKNYCRYIKYYLRDEVVNAKIMIEIKISHGLLRSILENRKKMTAQLLHVQNILDKRNSIVGK